ncbi:UDP-glycosyltransferase 92A1 [Abeliophyllum distichum]|uniref:UDP-glycosyltransferase 92A1 n=1 Tax=Abeliophyllum distichum TaxID=126358 RepID=A0ABD1RBE6_9LAMI
MFTILELPLPRTQQLQPNIAKSIWWSFLFTVLIMAYHPTLRTQSLPLAPIVNLFHASTHLEAPFRRVISEITVKDGRLPLCIISDVYMGWANDVAKSSGTLNETFTTGGACGSAAYVSLWQHLSHRLTGEDEFHLPGFSDACRFHLSQLHQFLRAADGTDSWSRTFCFYISFGSQNTISTSQMMALATGLEESGKPFVWVIRPPVGNNLNGEFQPEWLPRGFEERMARTKQGLVVHKWAPQLEILCHKSTGAFLSHCGWNSIMESLSQGVPIVGWPLAAEKGYTSKMLMEEMGLHRVN